MRTRRCSSYAAYLLPLFSCWIGSAPAQDAPGSDLPKADDARLVVERFAAAPDIVHPIGMTVDRRGRLLVIESHTHFRPANYQGPAHDRIRILEDTDGDGKADRFTTFFEGTDKTMDLALHPDGSIYLATRNEILRLRDSKGDGHADERQRIVFLDTKGDYPHNGLSGLTFDSHGNLFFGMGENLGAAYQLRGADGTTLAGEGEGGNVFWCTADGKQLRRVATGFWNPFSLGSDIFGRLFAVDNDPDAMPPCRLLHVVEGGDYGYQFRYGRSGRHPFQSWHGELPGTLPMASDTGEAPCKVISYEAPGLPRAYLGQLLVTSWADHRVERYVVSDRGASVKAERQPFVQGGKDFRPVGLAVAPDGSLFVSDWVLSDYQLHSHGAVWHIRPRQSSKPDRPTDARQALRSRDRTVREAAAQQLLKEGEAGQSFLRAQVRQEDPRVRATALTALIAADDHTVDLLAVADNDPLPPLRALAVRALATRGQDIRRFLDDAAPPSVRREALAGLKGKTARPRLLQFLSDADPFLRQAAIRQLARLPELLTDLELRSISNVAQRQGLLLAERASGRPEALQRLPLFLKDPDPEVRFLAAKWIADEKLTAYRSLLTKELKDPQLSVRLYYAYATALARIDNQDVNEGKMADAFVTRLTEAPSAPALQIAALRLIPPTHKKLTVDLLARLLAEPDPALQQEVVRVLDEHPDPRRLPLLGKVMGDPRYPENVRAEAIVGVAERAQENVAALLGLAEGAQAVLRAEALRALVGTALDASQRARLEALPKQDSDTELVARVLGMPFTKARPHLDDLSTWLKRLEGPADVAAGRRIFFQPRLAACARCHRVDGHGQDIGPDLSAVGRNERRHILESILQPDNLVPPHYQVWVTATRDGKVHTGMLFRTVLDDYTYVDAKGAQFHLNTRDIVESRAVPKSIMPTGLPDLLTDQEMRDLLAYLCSRR